MTTFGGSTHGGILAITPAGDLLTADLAPMAGSIFAAYDRSFNSHRNGSKIGNGLTSDEPCKPYAASFHEAGGQEWFEKIIVTPRKMALGFVLADVNFNINVWNTHRTELQTCLRVDFQDSGNVLIENPHGFPLSFGPMQARDFNATVPRDGDAVIQALAIFVFPGEAGTDLTVTGSRVIVFAVDADWSEPPKERLQYLTDILPGYNGNEQRIALRSRPRTQFSYKGMTLTRLESAALDALLWGWSGRVYGVPFWPDAQPLGQTVSAGNTIIQVSTGTRKFTAGGLAVLYRDIFNAEAVTILSVASGSITCTAPVNGTWPADGVTQIIPMLTGRLEGETQLRRLSNRIAEADYVFLCEGC